MAFAKNYKRRTPITMVSYPMTEEQTEEFYRLLFEQGGDAAREYREQFRTVRIIPADQ